MLIITECVVLQSGSSAGSKADPDDEDEDDQGEVLLRQNLRFYFSVPKVITFSASDSAHILAAIKHHTCVWTHLIRGGNVRIFIKRSAVG